MSIHDSDPIMKKLLILLLTAGIAGLGMADIQAPPQQKYGPVRKLSRAVANIVYGVTEIPVQWARSEQEGGSSEAFAYGTIFGGGKTVARLGYGIYELITFPFRTYKGTYRPPYHPDVREATHPSTGYLEFPPEVGFISGVQHCRTQVQ
jgi:putative exosortase-associated protein (TIGR04073 family)